MRPVLALDLPGLHRMQRGSPVKRCFEGISDPDTKRRNISHLANNLRGDLPWLLSPPFSPCFFFYFLRGEFYPIDPPGPKM